MSLFRGGRALALRIRQNYGGSNRLAEYATLVARAQEAGYELISLADFFARSTADEGLGRRWIALRHDVDIADVAGNEAIFMIERALGARSSFYFRQSTVVAHARLIPRLLDARFEVGYHFEEAASVAKRRGLRSRTEVLQYRQEIEDVFRGNCAVFRRRWNPGLESVSSHGDWINRKLGFTNNELVSPSLLAECGLRFEAYGNELLGRTDIYLSDVASLPERWAAGYGLAEAVPDGRGPIYLLTHERRWHSNRPANIRADLARISDALGYRLRR